jgi:hypothetical protein
MGGLLALLLLAGAPKPDVELKATPSMAMLPLGRAATVRLQVRIKDKGNEDYYCPRLEWEWEDGTMSTEESDCPPCEEAQPKDHERTWSRSRQFWEPGRQTVTVRLFKGDKVVRVLHVDVEIRGEATPGYLR